MPLSGGLGIEDNREVLTFIDGDVAVDPQWQPGHGHRLHPYARTDLALRGAADLLRKLHSAATGFHPAIPSYRFHPHPPPGRGDHLPRRWTFLPLAQPEQLIEAGFDPPPDLRTVTRIRCVR